MELIRILAKDSRSASEEVLKKYGKDALIVSNQKINGKTELIVAVDVVATEKTEMKDNHEKSKDSSNIDFSDIFESRLSRPEERPGVNRDSGIDQLSAEKESDQRDHLRAREIVELVRSELATIKSEINLARKAGLWNKTNPSNDNIQPLLEAIEDSSMPTTLRILVTEHLKDMENVQKARDELIQWLTKNSKHHLVDRPSEGIHVISGPSGAGKTTTVGRLACESAKELGSDNVAIISYNDTRLGAWNQTQLLASQSGVDSFRCKDLKTLKNLLNEIDGHQLILIDTPGIQLEKTREMLEKECSKLIFHLALPADSSLASIQSLMDKKRMIWSSVIISKTDEAKQPWPLICALCEFPIPFSVVGDSPDVQSSPKLFDVENFIESAVTNLLSSTNVEYNFPTEIPTGIESSYSKSNVNATSAILQARNSKKPEKIIRK